MKNGLKRILAFIVVNAILLIGVWGALTNGSSTDTGWQLWGWFLAIITIGAPATWFWWDKLNWLLDLED
jgi:hypothetical protein